MQHDGAIHGPPWFYDGLEFEEGEGPGSGLSEGKGLTKGSLGGT
jgi:hypothetical protein